MPQPSTAINISNLNGKEIIVGDSIIIPKASRIFATTRSRITNGTKRVSETNSNNDNRPKTDSNSQYKRKKKKK